MAVLPSRPAQQFPDQLPRPWIETTLQIQGTQDVRSTHQAQQGWGCEGPTQALRSHGEDPPQASGEPEMKSSTRQRQGGAPPPHLPRRRQDVVLEARTPFFFFNLPTVQARREEKNKPVHEADRHLGNSPSPTRAGGRGPSYAARDRGARESASAGNEGGSTSTSTAQKRIASVFRQGFKTEDHSPQCLLPTRLRFSSLGKIKKNHRVTQ